MDSIPGLVALLTPAGDVEVVNRQVLEYFGQTLEELKQWGTNDTIHPEDLPHVIDVFTRSIALRQSLRNRAALSAVGWRLSLVPEQRLSSSRYKRPHRSLVRAADGHRRAEARRGRARASERNLKLIIDTIPALAWSARPDGTAEFFNQHYLDFMGLSAEQASDWGWTAAVHPDDLNGLAATWQRIMASEAPGEAEARLRRHDGEYRWFLFRANPLRDEKGTSSSGTGSTPTSKTESGPRRSSGEPTTVSPMPSG